MARAGAVMSDTLGQVGASLLTLKITLIELAVHYGLQVLASIVILLVGLRVSRWAGNALDVWLTKKALDVSLRGLVVRIFRILIMIGTALIAAEKAGIPVTSLIAGVGVAGIGAGFALQGVLGNVFAGLTILFTRPFRVGEYIDVLTESGEVIEITVFTTTLRHADRSKVVIPNRKIVGEILHNYSTLRQMDLRLGIAYASDLDKALRVVRETVAADARVLAEPAPIVGISELGDSAIVISARPWVAVPDFDATRVALYKALVEACRSAGVELPFPQREVRLLGPAADLRG